MSKRIQRRPSSIPAIKKTTSRNLPITIFQTVDIGTGYPSPYSHYPFSVWSRFPNRKYVAVDIDYGTKGNGRPPSVYNSLKNVRVSSLDMLRFVKKMLRKNWRTKNFNIDMPNLYRGTPLAILTLISIAQRVLLPNGKIFLTTEEEPLAKKIIEIGNGSGFSAKPLRKLHPRAENRTSDSNKFSPVFCIELTYRLKKAYPEKSKRRNWSKVITGDDN